MPRGLFALAILLTLSLSALSGCNKKRGTTTTAKPAAGQASTTEDSLKAAEQILSMIPADSPSIMAVLNWGHLLQLTGDLQTALGHSAYGQEILGKIHDFSASAPVPLPIGKKEMEHLGLDPARPMAVFGGATPMAIFSIKDASAFQTTLATAYGKGSWKEVTVQGAKLQHLSGTRQLFCLPKDRLSICSPDSDGLVKATQQRPKHSVWSLLGPWQERLDRTSALIGFSHPKRLKALALVQREDDGLSASLRLAGPGLAPVQAMLGGKGAGTLLPLAGEAPTVLYLRTKVAMVLNAINSVVPNLSELKLDPIRLQSGLTGEVLLQETTDRQLALILGCRDPKVSLAVVEALAQVARETIKARTAAGQPVPIAITTTGQPESRRYTISVNAAVGSFPVKVDIVLAAGPPGILLGTAGAIQTLTGDKPPAGSRAGGDTLLLGRFPLADPLSPLGKAAEGLLRSAGLPGGVIKQVNLARFLLDQMYGVTVTLNRSGAAQHLLDLRLRTLHQQGGKGADQAREVWNKALLARAAGEQDKAAGLLKGLAKDHPGTRHGKRAANPRPGLLGAMATAVLTSAALPAYRQYINRSRQAEVHTYLPRLAISGRFSFKSPGKTPQGAPLPRRFPDTVEWTPKESCCQGSGGQCQPRVGLWLNPTWKALRFAMNDPHRFQYRFINKGVVNKRHAFEVQARGDIDCSGKPVTFSIGGKTDEEGNVVLTPMRSSQSLPTKEKR